MQLCSDNKCTVQLRSNCAADLRLCFRICKTHDAAHLSGGGGGLNLFYGLNLALSFCSGSAVKSVTFLDNKLLLGLNIGNVCRATSGNSDQLHLISRSTLRVKLSDVFPCVDSETIDQNGLEFSLGSQITLLVSPCCDSVFEVITLLHYTINTVHSPVEVAQLTHLYETTPFTTDFHFRGAPLDSQIKYRTANIALATRVYELKKYTIRGCINTYTMLTG